MTARDRVATWLCALATYVVMTFLAYVVVSSFWTPAFPQVKKLKIAEPPWQFDYPYRGELTIKYLLPHEVHNECTDGLVVPFNRLVIACAAVRHDGAECLIILPLNVGQYSEAEMQLIIRHERAHCNGWPPDHSDTLEVRQ